MARTIGVYADWDGLGRPIRLGLLHIRRGATNEVLAFEFDLAALALPALANVQIDPRIGHFQGRQHPPQGHSTFGVFTDASPDRWGRMLMRRRLERAQRAGQIDKAASLHESDYLLGVHDAFRVGALRFRLNDTGDFLDDQHHVAAPPFVQLRELEAASLALERDEQNTAEAGDDWLRMLIAPAGSLGGARPKASVMAPDGTLWIAKFPSIRDEHNVGAWEMIVHTLARKCGLSVPRGLARRFANPHHTFLVQRFDRTSTDKRLHFASAMTLTGHQDGDDASTGASYLEIARVIMDHGAHTDTDLRELWSRIVFNMLVSNADDHLRNHGFLLVPGMGWGLSAAYDMNSEPGSHGLKLNVSEVDNAIDLDLARSVAPFFRVSRSAAAEIIQTSQAIVRTWPAVAAELGIPGREQARMKSAFRLAG